MLLLGLAIPLQAADSGEAFDASLEQALDEYLNVLDVDPEEANRFLAELIAGLGEVTPLGSRVRAEGYQALDLAYSGEHQAGLTIVERLVTMAEQSDIPDVRTEALAMLIEIFAVMNENAEALNRAPLLEPWLAQAESPRIRYYAHNVLARLYRQASEPEKSLENFIAAYDAVMETNDDRTLSRRLFLNMNIAFLQSDLRQYQEALGTTQRAIRTAEDAERFSTLAELLLLRGFLESSLEQHQASIDTHFRAIEVARRQGLDGVEMVSMNNIGAAYIQLEKYDEAETILEQALDKARTLDDEIMVQLIFFNLGYIAVMQGDHEQGLATLESATEQLRADYSPSELASLLSYVVTAQREAGALDKAIDTLLEQRALNESLFRAERESSLAELQARYDLRDQATQIELLEQRNALQERLIEIGTLQRRVTQLFAVVVLLGLVLLFIALKAARRANLRLKAANQQLKYQSSHDPLTGLVNRRLFQQHMKDRALERSKHGQSSHADALLLLDIDFFKKINDSYGHAAGDRVLINIGKRLQAICRDSDMVVRWGGEEILMFLKTMNPDSLTRYAEKVLKAIGDTPVEYEGQTIRVTATGGFISLPFAEVDESRLNWEKALLIADLALYIGKTQGRNRAIGVLGLNKPFDGIGTSLQTDLSGAIEKGWVSSVVVEGPAQAS